LNARRKGRNLGTGKTCIGKGRISGSTSMTLLCNTLGVAYFPVPKSASTTLRHYFHEIDTGMKWIRGKEGVGPHLLPLGPGAHVPVPFAKTNLQELEGYETMAVVREPVARLISCYSHHIVIKPRGLKRISEKYNLPECPDFATFVDHLASYRTVSRRIRSHSHLLSHWLGSDLSFFDAIFDFAALPVLGEWLQSRGGGPITHHRNKSARKRGIPPGHVTCTASAIAKIREFYAEDYALFGHIFGSETGHFSPAGAGIAKAAGAANKIGT